ncbi:MAG: phage major capsid protein [Dehalococcoidia bacterium]
MTTQIKPSLAQLNEELEQTVYQFNQLQDRKNLSDAEKGEMADLHERALKTRKAIEIRQDEERRADMEALRAWTEDPNYRIPRAVNPDEDGRKALAKSGWEVKSGMIMAPTMKGASVPFCPEEVLFGAFPTDDADGVTYFKKMRAIFQPEYRTAYVKWITSKHRNDGAAIATLEDHEYKALSEGSDGSGGFLVPPDIQSELLVRKAQMAVMRRLCQVRNTSRDRLVLPRVKPHATSSVASIYSSGFVGGWVGETPAFSDTDPGFGTFEISIKKLRVATKVSNDLIADAAANILAFLGQNGAQNMALVEDSGFLIGDGSPLQPFGLLNDADLITNAVDVEGSVSNTISNSTSNVGSVPKILNMVYGLPSQYAENAQWLMRRAIEGDVHKLVDADGRFMWPPLSGSGFAANTRQLLGYPINNSEFMPNDGEDAARVLLFGDFSAYVIADRTMISTIVLRERFADTDQTGIILMERVGGALWNDDALRAGKV